MNKKLDDKLCEKYPLIFAQRNMPMTETCMCWGFECGDGWYDLINTLCYSIQSYLNSNTDVPQVVATQVKSKFNGLRFYYEGGDDVTDWMISLAETMSEKIKE
jgi:hypothetical protein